MLLLLHNFSAISLKSRSVLAENFGREGNRSLAALIEAVGVSEMKKGASFVRIRKDHTHFKNVDCFVVFKSESVFKASLTYLLLPR